MASIVHILLGLIIAILRAFATAFLLLFTKAALITLSVTGVLILVLMLTGTISLGFFRRSDR